MKDIVYSLIENEKNYPDQIAIRHNDETINYRELNQYTNRLAELIKDSQSPLIVYGHMSPYMIVGMLASLKAGCGYVPIDVSMPEDRISSIIEKVEPDYILNTTESLLDIKHNHIFDLNIFNDMDTSIKFNALIEDKNIAYTIFTSGSTGVPKGVTISHRSTIDFIDHFVETFEITDKDVIANQAPFDFDVSVKDIYTTIKTGATMHIVPKTLFILIPKLMDYLNDKKVTVIIWAVSALTLISNMGGFKRSVPQYLKKVMFSGEVMPTKQLNVWKHYVPNACYVNLYGPTEITCNCLYYIVDRDFEDTEQLPLGSPFDNTEVFLLNEENQIAKDDEIGELCVRGTSLALGYYNNPEATLKAFVQNPLNKNYPELIYRTGDLAQKNVNGELIYSSRRDFQIKHMGHRIELGEIEFAINSLDKIKANVCLYNKKTSKIVCVYQGDNADPKYILEGLKPILPKFMFPHIFIAVDQMPLNKNSKIDRVYLKEKYIDGIN